MKQLFCVVVTDPDYVICLDSPIIFHMRCDDPLDRIEEAAKEMLVEEYNFAEETVDQVDIFYFPVTDLDIIEL